MTENSNKMILRKTGPNFNQMKVEKYFEIINIPSGFNSANLNDPNIRSNQFHFFSNNYDSKDIDKLEQLVVTGKIKYVCWIIKNASIQGFLQMTHVWKLASSGLTDLLPFDNIKLFKCKYHVTESINYFKTKDSFIEHGTAKITKKYISFQERLGLKEIEIDKNINEDLRLNLKYGQKSIQLCENEKDFFGLLDNLVIDNGRCHGFYCNRNDILKAYKENRLYMIKLIETPYIYEMRRYLFDYGYFMKGTFDGIPAFCVLNEEDDSIVDYIYVDKKLRRLGLASFMIYSLDIESENNPLPEDSVNTELYDDKYKPSEIEKQKLADQDKNYPMRLPTYSIQFSNGDIQIL